jgi:hypothetical protein
MCDEDDMPNVRDIFKPVTLHRGRVAGGERYVQDHKTITEADLDEDAPMSSENLMRLRLNEITPEVEADIAKRVEALKSRKYWWLKEDPDGET